MTESRSAADERPSLAILVRSYGGGTRRSGFDSRPFVRCRCATRRRCAISGAEPNGAELGHPHNPRLFWHGNARNDLGPASQRINGDEAALELAKRWSKIAGVLFAIGAVSGTILSFEMGLLWPGLMEQYGDVLGTAFALEGLSFFIEAIFLGIYVYGWGRLAPRTHVLMLLPMVIAGVTGSFFVLSVNEWMNAPTGFTEVDGVVIDVDPLAAIFNSAVPLQFLHMFLAAYMVTGFGLASIYGFGWLRGRRGQLQRLGILVPLTFAAIATPIQPIVGHFAGQRIADDQPIKLAAIEGLADTEDSVNTVIGGVYTGGELVG